MTANHRPEIVGRKVLIMGAASEVGRAIALAFADEGALLALTTATTDAEEALAMRRLAKEIADRGGKAISEMVDMSIGANVQVAMRQIVKALDGLDVLVVSTDFDIARPAERIGDAEWARLIGQNMSAVFYACRGAAREMLGREGGGRVIVVTPAAAESGGSAAYQAAKAGIEGLVRALAAEWRERGVGVTQVAASADGTEELASRIVWLATDAPTT